MLQSLRVSSTFFWGGEGDAHPFFIFLFFTILFKCPLQGEKHPWLRPWAWHGWAGIPWRLSHPPLTRLDSWQHRSGSGLPSQKWALVAEKVECRNGAAVNKRRSRLLCSVFTQTNRRLLRGTLGKLCCRNDDVYVAGIGPGSWRYPAKLSQYCSLQ